jgi:phosphatidate cytidylyltransferase
MLKQRIITAVLMLAVLIPSVWADDTRAFVLITAAMIGAGAWEWSRLCGWRGAGAWLAGAAATLVCALCWWGGLAQSNLFGLWALVGAAWVLLAARFLATGVAAWAAVAPGLRLVCGLVVLVSAWLALVQARLLGINFLFSVLVLVWGADVAAYFCGRFLGGRWIARKLAVRISPGKTWEGALGGLLAVLLIAFVWQAQEVGAGWGQPSLYTRLFSAGPLFAVVAVVFLTTMSVAGDLPESLFMRAAGVKDGPALLPGHGGVLDRVDALLPVLPVALLVCTA